MAAPLLGHFQEEILGNFFTKDVRINLTQSRKERGERKKVYKAVELGSS
jgi:hypothetical protein